MTIDSKKIEDIKYRTMFDNQGVYPGAHLSKLDFDYLIMATEKGKCYEKVLKELVADEKNWFSNPWWIDKAKEALEGIDEK
ncbi:hypothetical protein [Niallia sp. 03091]|uniref:hypothetical protein n=1 Tax=Niallia sp. 03091 TaxID=3458059 RepID=UPI004043D135